MNIKKILALALSFSFIVVSLTGCRKVGGDMSSGCTSDQSSIAYDIVDIVENDNESGNESTSSDLQSTQSVGSDNAQSSTSSNKNTSSTTSNKNTSGASSNYTDNIVSVGNGGNSNNSNVDPDPPKTFIDTETETETGKATYSTAPDDNNCVITVDIEAGKSVYYKIRGAANRFFTINSPNAYVVFAGDTYSAQDGKVSFFVETNQLSSDQILFEIGNKGTQTESFTIVFADLKGTWDNKEELSAFDEKIITSLEEGNEVGYWYTHTATQKGKIRFYLLSGTDVGVLLVTNNRNSAQRSTEEDVKTDSIGSYIVLDVKQGDEIVINIGAKSNDTSKYPAAKIEWMAKYE